MKQMEVTELRQSGLKKTPSRPMVRPAKESHQITIFGQGRHWVWGLNHRRALKEETIAINRSIYASRPKAEKHPTETSGKKKGKQKREAESPLNDGATSTVLGGEPSTTKNRNVKKKYEDEQPVVSSNMSNMSSSMTASTCSYEFTKSLHFKCRADSGSRYVHVPLSSLKSMSKFWSSNWAWYRTAATTTTSTCNATTISFPLTPS